VNRLIDEYDAALCDLDGVVYLGPQPIPGSAETIRQLQAEHVKVGFVTNNAGRAAQVVVDQLRGFEIECSVDDVVTSGQAVADLMAQQLPAGSKVFVCGTQALRDEITARGFELVEDHTGQPDALVQGYEPKVTWPRLEQAAFAVQQGAKWYAANLDSNRPTDQGLVPGTGAQVAVVGTCVDFEPITAGKPHPPLLRYTIKRLETARPIFVGDRLDTDIEGANNVDMDSLFVFTGSHGKADLASASERLRPSAIGYDLSALLEPRRVASVADGEASCGAVRVKVVSGDLVIEGETNTRDSQLDALWAGLQLIWAADGDLSYGDFLADLHELG